VLKLSQNFVIPFGKYKNYDLLHVAESEPKYLIWLDSVAEGNLKIALESFLNSKYFKDCLIEHEYEDNEEDMWDWNN
jgi:hypothetical protein